MAMQEFTFAGQRYLVDKRAYDDGLVILPDGRMLLIRRWSANKGATRPDDLILLGITVDLAKAVISAA